MQMPTSPSSARRVAGLGLLLLLVLPGAAVAMLDCEKIVTDGFTFNLGALKGPHTVITSVHHEPLFTNVSYTLDVCAPLKKRDDVKKEEDCPNGSWVCGIWHTIHTGRKTDEITEVRPIAGNLDGRTLDHEVTRLSTSPAEGDKGKEGLRLVLHGGRFEGKAQTADIEFICDDKLEGTEGEWKSEELGIPPPAAAAVAEDGDGDGDKKPADDVPHQLRKEGAALVWDSYGPDEEKPSSIEVLRLTWKTKHACEKRSDNGGGGGGSDGGSKDESKHWGFFTWMVILVFLGAAAYLIFGSWLNYNRYGARGWDLLPHGDTLRDIPYLMQDWVRRLVQTLQGGGARGGYSAV